MGADKGVGVGWVTDDSNLDGLLGNSIDSGTLSLENLSIGLEKVGTLHTGASWSSTNEDGNIDVLEANHGVDGGNDVLHASVGTILKLHDETLEDLFGLREFDELKNDLLVRSEHSALSNEVAKEGANLTSSSGNSDTDRGLLKVARHCGEMSTEGLKSANEDVLLHLSLLIELFFYLTVLELNLDRSI